MSTPTYDQVRAAALSGTRSVVEHLPLEAIGQQIGQQIDRVQGLDWDDLPLSDLDLDDTIGEVIAEVNSVVRRHPVAVAVIVVAAVAATSAVFVAMRRRSQRRAAGHDDTDLRLAGVA